MNADLIAAIEEAYDVSLPDRYRAFLAKGEYETLPFLDLQVGFLEGCFEPVFDDEDYLCDLDAIGEDYGIEDMMDVVWEDEFEGFLPFAVLDDLEDEDEADDEDLVGAFLVVKIDDPACPIYLWDAEGWMLYPLASSLDDFIAGVAWAGAKPSRHPRLGEAYEAFEWVDDPDD